MEVVQPAGTSYAKLWSACRRLFREDQANTTTEYTVMVAIIIVAIFFGLSSFSDRLEEIYAQIDSGLSVTVEGG